MADLGYLKRNVFPGESGGDYNALFGYANRPGGQFAGVKLTDMTVDQALQFANPSGPYGQSVKGQIGRVATPMGAYQIVGTTLRAAKDGLGLTGNERMTPELQDQLGMWIYQNQGPAAWEAWGKGGGGGNVTASTKGAPMGLLNFEDQPQPMSFMERLGIQRRDPSMSGQTALPFYQRDNFTDALGSIGAALMGMDITTRDMAPAMMAQVEARKAKRSDAEKRNRTAEVLAQISPEAAALVREGMMSPADALGIYRDQRATDLARQASEALARGDTATAYALSLQISPQAAGQAIAQQYGPRSPEITGGGMYTVTYENGVPKVSVNTDVQNAELERIRTEAEIKREGQTKTPPSSVIKAEEEDFAALDTIDQLTQGLDVVVNDFGYDPTTGEFTGPLKDAFGASGAVTGLIGSYTGFSEGASETARARERFERWKTSYVNDSLQLNKGVQTEGDAQRAAAELQGASTVAAAYSALQDLVRANEKARAIKERAITGRRGRFGLDPVDIPAAVNPPDLGWRVVE